MHRANPTTHGGAEEQRRSVSPGSSRLSMNADDPTASGLESRREQPWWRGWIIALQPYSTPVGIVPVIVGTAIAVHLDVFAPLPALAAFLGALGIQHGADLTNVYFDYQKGVDTGASHDASGEKSVIRDGYLRPEQVLRGAVLLFVGAMVVGLYLVYIGGVPVLLIGVASIVAGYTYSGGPYPYGHHALGDLFAFTFFGVVAVSGTVYVQAAGTLAGPFPYWIPPGTLPPAALIGSLSMAGLIAGLLVVNNIRDIETDAAAGKTTLAVRIGYRWSRVEYGLLLALAFAVPVWFLRRGDAGWPVLLPWLILPMAIRNFGTVLRNRDGDALNPALARQVRLTAGFGLLFSVGLVL